MQGIPKFVQRILVKTREGEYPSSWGKSDSSSGFPATKASMGLLMRGKNEEKVKGEFRGLRKQVLDSLK